MACWNKWTLPPHDLESEVGRAVAGEGARRPVGVAVATWMAAGLVAAIRTPLGPLAGDLRLADIGREDRLDEVGFELPLAGGDRPIRDVLMDGHRHPLLAARPTRRPAGRVCRTIVQSRAGGSSPRLSHRQP